MKYKIEKGIPWPPLKKSPVSRGSSTSEMIRLWERMEVGDSVFFPLKSFDVDVPAKLQRKLAGSAKLFSRYYTGGRVMFSVRTSTKNGREGFRIWRVFDWS